MAAENFQSPPSHGVPVFSNGLLELLTRRMGLLADPRRVRLLLELERGEACVQQLADELGVAHKVVSQNLNMLHREGLVSRRRQGSLMVYQLTDYSICHLIRKAVEGVEAQIEELSELITT